MRKVFLAKPVVELVYKFDELVLPRTFVKESRTLKHDSKFFGPSSLSLLIKLYIELLRAP